MAKAGWGTHYLDALETRYQDEEMKLEIMDHEKGRTKEVLFVGKEYCKRKMAMFDKFFEINLFQCQISDKLPPADHPLKDIRFEALQMLSLDENLISSWATVLDLAGRCPQLEFLSLIGNKLQSPFL